jgi:hypothetical protein
MARNHQIHDWRVASILLLVFTAGIVGAQNHLELRQNKIVHGVIIDGATFRGIANAYISTPSLGVISDAEGNFSIALSFGDSLHFSHVSYLPYHTIFNATLSHNKFVIVLSPKITFLKEVIVTPLTEADFQNKVLETTPQLSMEEEIAKENVQILNRAAKFAMPLQMDSYQSYQDYIKGPQGVVLFSSNGSKGLVKAIKNVIRSTPYKFPSTFKRSGNLLRNTNKAKIASPIR